MPFFKKRDSPEDEWTLSQGTWSGNPIIVRFNKTVGKRRDVKRKLQFKVKIVVPLHHPDGQGFPVGAEADQLGAIEDRLISDIEKEGNTVLVGVLTSSGMREFSLYTDSPEQVNKNLAELANQIASHQLQFAIRSDPIGTCIRSSLPNADGGSS